ncbi:arylacetamide deacetylase-like [Plakobranchus ocellatus]|uniref:Arylacetamide deacetylase-like n=1 Tax=Plakobranchus ocellatus TaxID=259542 RepID=A0AAV4B0F5_9GAST|nr:arylacetamide deacetylase-like [Plakobranchus ocellatus]
MDESHSAMYKEKFNFLQGRFQINQNQKDIGQRRQCMYHYQGTNAGYSADDLEGNKKSSTNQMFVADFSLPFVQPFLSFNEFPPSKCRVPNSDIGSYFQENSDNGQKSFHRSRHFKNKKGASKYHFNRLIDDHLQPQCVLRNGNFARYPQGKETKVLENMKSTIDTNTSSACAFNQNFQLFKDGLIQSDVPTSGHQHHVSITPPLFRFSSFELGDNNEYVSNKASKISHDRTFHRSLPPTTIEPTLTCASAKSGKDSHSACFLDQNSDIIPSCSLTLDTKQQYGYANIKSSQSNINGASSLSTDAFSPNCLHPIASFHTKIVSSNTVRSIVNSVTYSSSLHLKNQDSETHQCSKAIRLNHSVSVPPNTAMPKCSESLTFCKDDISRNSNLINPKYTSPWILYKTQVANAISNNQISSYSSPIPNTNSHNGSAAAKTLVLAHSNTAHGRTAKKRTRRHIPHAMRSPSAVDKRNCRERRRIGGVNQAFEILRRHTPTLSHLERASKISILRQAHAYIRELSNCLRYRRDMSCI